MQDLLSELAKILGIDPSLLEGSAITLLAGALIYMTRTLLASQQTEGKQVIFEQKLVELAAASVEESRKLRLAYEDNIQSTKANIQATVSNNEVLRELVDAAHALRSDMPAKLAEHENAMVKMFVDKADEMHQVTQKRDAEIAAVLEQLNACQHSIEDVKRQISDATDETTLRSQIDRIVTIVNELAKMIEEKPAETTAEQPSEAVR